MGVETGKKKRELWSEPHRSIIIAFTKKTLKGLERKKHKGYTLCTLSLWWLLDLWVAISDHTVLDAMICPSSLIKIKVLIPSPARNDGCSQLIAEFLHTHCPWPKEISPSKVIPSPWGWSTSNSWLVQGCNGLAPLPQFETTLKHHPVPRVPHGIGWGLCCDCVVAHLLPLPNLLPSLPHKNCSQDHSPVNFLHINLCLTICFPGNPT